MRVLCWNIKFFRLNADYMAWGAPLILRSIYPVLPAPPPAPPAAPAVDVFAILEVQNRTGGAHVIGAPLGAASAGAQAVVDLWGRLTALNAPGVADWQLVPPLSLANNKRDEGIAVFYNAQTVQFLGPNRFGGAVSERNPAAPQAWPAPWDAADPGPHFWAARVDFNPPGLNAVLTQYRRPYQVRFRDLAAPNPTVDLFFVHTTPPLRMNPDLGTNPSLQACHFLALIDEVANPTHAGVTATAVLGDFNVNAANPVRWNWAFGPMQAVGGYAPGLPVGAPGAPGAAVPTMLLQAGSAVPPNPIPAPPAVDTYYWSKWSVDNVLWAPAAATVNAQAHVVDRTAGSPNPPWPSTMAQTMAQIWAPPAGERGMRFNRAQNHGQNRRLSDHAGLAVQIP